MKSTLVAATIAFGIMPNLNLYAASEDPIGDFSYHGDVGAPAISGETTYDLDTQTYTLSGAGKNMWADDDQFQFAYNKMSGDFIVRATIEFVGEGVDPHRKIGIMARNSLDPDSEYADACVHGDTLTSLQFRETKGGETDQVVISSHHPTDIEFQRQGDVYTFSAARFGETYKTVTKELSLKDELYVGLFICSHREDVVETAKFSNVRVILPAPEDFQPYRDYIGSRLEIMDVETGHRKVLAEFPNSIQAPNWTPDGESLIYNSEGKLYRYNIASGSIDLLNTGFADQNNNDHVLSPDGSKIAISHHVGQERISTLYTLPIEGSSQPVQITDPNNGHSFLHDWSPDGSKLIFTANRNDQWDIWEIDIASREESPLTNEPTLDDGSEFTPDGEYIYFNSVRTGTMQIWRMKPDGSDPEQVTFDAYNDWFAHPSPDGKSIVYLSYPVDIDPTDHPWYRKVYLRLMPATGGVPKTIAYVYGGQGTINVPSWSPDSTKIAFVSNSQLPLK